MKVIFLQVMLTLIFCTAVLGASEISPAFGPHKFEPNRRQEVTFPGQKGVAYKLIINNGTGEAYYKKCPKNSLPKIDCESQNDLKIDLERVASAEITLNGKRVVTPKEFNINTQVLTLEIPVEASNVLVVHPRGKFSSFLTVEVHGPKDTTEPKADFIIDLEENIQESHISISGTSTGQLDFIRVANVIGVGFSEAVVQTDKKFTIPSFLLKEGVNTITVEGLYKNQVVLSKSFNIFVDIPAPGKSQMSHINGATVIVSDVNNPLYGAKMVVPPGAVERDFFVRIDSGSHLLPNLPFGHIEVGPVVTFYPIWAEYLLDVIVSIPFDNALLPSGTHPMML